jgi:hypothetical protein
MAKLKTQRIIVREKDENGYEIRGNRGEGIGLDFSIDINVAQGGDFTTTLPEIIVDKLKDAGIELMTNGRRNARPGFFEASTLQELIKNVEKACGEFVSKKLISEKIIIRYIIETTCRYAVNDKGNMIPYPSYDTENEKKYTERSGSVQIYSQQPGTFGFRVWSEVVRRRIYKYASGNERKFDDNVSGMHDVRDDQPMLMFLTSLYCQKQANGVVHEMEYTEETAKFFVDLYKAIFLINEKIKDRVTPEKIVEIIANNQKLLS